MDSGGLWRNHRCRRVGAVLPEGQTLLLEPTLPRDLLDPTGEQPASGGVWYWLADWSRGEGSPHPFMGATRVVDKGGMFKAGVAGLFHVVLCSFRLVPGPDA